MFGLSFGKILVLAVVVIGAWQFFKWIEKRAGSNGSKPVKKRETAATVDEEKPGEVELEQDPHTGVWRPKNRD